MVLGDRDATRAVIAVNALAIITATDIMPNLNIDAKLVGDPLKNKDF